MLDLDQRRVWRDTADDSDRVMRIATTEDGRTTYLGHFQRGLVAISLNDCLLRAARIYGQCNMLAEAAPLYEVKNDLTKAIDLYVRMGEFSKAAVLAERLGDIEQAAGLFEQAGEFEEAAVRFERANLIERAADCYSLAGNKSRAGGLLAQLGDVQKAAELHFQNGDFVAAGKLFEKAGSAKEALSAYEKAVEAGSLTPDGAIGLGRLYLSNQRSDDAIKVLQPVARDAEFGHEAVKLLAECFMQKGMYSLAADRYREAVAGQEEAVAEHLDTFYGLARAYEQAGMYDNARETYHKIVAADYYYKDVTGRLEHIDEMSSVFAAAGAASPTGTSSGAQVTVPVPQQSRYEILRKLGEGGMGVVYLAKDTKLGREVALKVLPSKFSNNDEFRTRFVREARAVAGLSHKNIVSVYDIGELRGESFISMEFIEGKSLRDILRSRGKLSAEETCNFAKQIAEGLGAAHRKGIVHRDIKPENIMVTADTGEVKIMDFGLARIDQASNLTQEGSVMGTWRYMAPEQVEGLRAKPATDIYATGVIIFEMTTGAPIFTEGDLAFHHVNTLPPRLVDVAPDVPAALDVVVARCLHKSPDDRYADGMELWRALDAIDEGA